MSYPDLFWEDCRGLTQGKRSSGGRKVVYGVMGMMSWLIYTGTAIHHVQGSLWGAGTRLIIILNNNLLARQQSQR